jgi:hypothetical protein
MRRSAFCLFILLAFVLAGCRSSHPTLSSSDLPPETILFTLGPVNPPPGTHIGHIMRTNSVDLSQMMEVDVCGCVNKPGRVSVPKGATALQAIKKAGGFEKIGASYYLRIKRGGATYGCLLATKSLSPEMHNHYLIWYVPYEWSEARGRNVVDRQARSDFLLQPGDLVFVPGVL